MEAPSSPPFEYDSPEQKPKTAQKQLDAAVSNAAAQLQAREEEYDEWVEIAPVESEAV